MLATVLEEKKQKSGSNRIAQFFFKLLSFKWINQELYYLKKNNGKVFLNINILLVTVLNIKIVCVGSFCLI